MTLSDDGAKSRRRRKKRSLRHTFKRLLTTEVRWVVGVLLFTVLMLIICPLMVRG